MRAPASGAENRLACLLSAGRESWAAPPGAKTSPDLAAFANGILFRYLSILKRHVLVVGTRPPQRQFRRRAGRRPSRGRRGPRMITAAVLAYEIQCRLCDAASIRKHGWDHVTYGAFSTAAAAARLLGLGAEADHAGAQSRRHANVTLRQTRAGELSEWKGCAFANASRNGCSPRSWRPKG